MPIFFQDQVIAKHPPEYYIEGLQTYIRGANLVEKASTLVCLRLPFVFLYPYLCIVEKKATN